MLTIFLWLTCIVVAFFSGILTFYILFQNASFRESWQTLLGGIRQGLKEFGLPSGSSRYPVELYVWETIDDEDVCEDCLERACWPAMDIADWFKEGLPGTPEAETECGKKCRCQLVPYHPQKHRQTRKKIQ